MHEIIEFTQIDINKVGHCANAERIVLEEIPQKLKKVYVERRIIFFTNLSKFLRNDIEESKGNYTKEDLQEAVGSLDYLHSIQYLL